MAGEVTTMNKIKFTLKLADGRSVGSPTHVATGNPNLAGVFSAADSDSAAEQRRSMERIHGPLESVPFNLHPNRTGAGSDDSDPLANAEVIYSYTRKQALADGEQIDVSVTAAEAGIRFPVFLTRAVWEKYVRVPEGVQCQDERGRLWDVVWMLRMAARQTSGLQMRFRLHVQNDNRRGTPPSVTLKAECGPLDIDDPRPAITVMLPEQ